MQNPIVAILAAGVAAWLFGSAWYMSLGKVYQAALGTTAECKDRKMPLAPLVVCLVAEWVMAAVLYQTLDHLGVSGWMGGAIAGAVLGAGLIFTTIIVNNMFQQRSFTVSVIDGLHWTIVAAIEGAVIGAFL